MFYNLLKSTYPCTISQDNGGLPTILSIMLNWKRPSLSVMHLSVPYSIQVFLLLDLRLYDKRLDVDRIAYLCI
jgi:hypothetical protein